MNWTDATTYSRFDKERIPRILELPPTKKMKLVVQRHIYDESTWFMRINNSSIDMVNLKTDDIEEAKAKAVKYAITYLHIQKEEIEAAIKQLQE